ncbi:MAG: periplasmic heavy metal sensor [Candidatus Omnitrophica bacterium]|nr:periplasmic heavy metal sensor [Candidatus Omnitrophota bacterium]MDD5652939.1 periplasmic heavy metal sensor [Candidatus Omnitrophota bacterium]
MITEREKIFVAVTVVLLAVLAYFFFASSQAPYSRQEKGFGSFGRMHPGGERFFKSLGLTSEQQMMLEQNRNKHREISGILFAQTNEKREAIRQELQKEQLNKGKILQLATELKAIQAQIVDEKISGMLEVRKIVTPAQFNQFISQAQAGPGRFFKGRQDREKDLF